VSVAVRRSSSHEAAVIVSRPGSIVISWKLDLASHGVAVLGTVPGGLPKIGFPSVALSDVPALMGTAVSIFVLILAQSAATSRAYAARYNEDFDENVDLVGLGAANILAGVSGTFVVNGSPTKTQMVDGAGGRSQLSQVTTGLIVAIVLLFLTVPLQYMPKAVLAAVVFLIGVQLVDLAGMRRILEVRPTEFVVATLTAVVVVVLGVEQGIVVAIVVDHRPPPALVPARHRRARAAGGTGWHSVPASPTPAAPGLVIYRPSALYYANAEYFVGQVLSFAASDDPVAWISLDAAAIPDIDFTGAEALRSLHEELSTRHIRLVFSDVMHVVRTELERRAQRASSAGAVPSARRKRPSWPGPGAVVDASSAAADPAPAPPPADAADGPSR
jgi:MFS superfamily sulfate permease-like transporter